MFSQVNALVHQVHHHTSTSAYHDTLQSRCHPEVYIIHHLSKLYGSNTDHPCHHNSLSQTLTNHRQPETLSSSWFDTLYKSAWLPNHNHRYNLSTTRYYILSLSRRDTFRWVNTGQWLHGPGQHTVLNCRWVLYSGLCMVLWRFYHMSWRCFILLFIIGFHTISALGFDVDGSWRRLEACMCQLYRRSLVPCCLVDCTRQLSERHDVVDVPSCLITSCYSRSCCFWCTVVSSS